MEDFENTLAAIQKAFADGGMAPPEAAEHLRRLVGMSMIGATQALERFLKDVAAVCVDSGQWR